MDASLATADPAARREFSAGRLQNRLTPLPSGLKPLISRYDLTGVPVVDHGDHLIGVITVDDLVEVLEDEATEDIQRIGGAQPLDRPYLDSSVRATAWVESPLMAAVVSGSIFAIVLWANGVGSLLPLLAARFGADPALVSGPLVSTPVDATGLLLLRHRLGGAGALAMVLRCYPNQGATVLKSPDPR